MQHTTNARWVREHSQRSFSDQLLQLTLRHQPACLLRLRQAMDALVNSCGLQRACELHAGLLSGASQGLCPLSLPALGTQMCCVSAYLWLSHKDTAELLQAAVSRLCASCADLLFSHAVLSSGTGLSCIQAAAHGAMPGHLPTPLPHALGLCDQEDRQVRHGQGLHRCCGVQ